MRKLLLAGLAALCGALPAQESQVSLREENGKRVIESNGWPDHAPGEFPNPHNPNSIRERRHHYEVPLKPLRAAGPTRIGMSPFGVILNGVPLDPSAAEWWRGDPSSGWQYEAIGGLDLGLDEHEAHVQPDGSYHYHGLPKGTLLKDAPDGHSPLMGWAADGFPIYGPKGYADPKHPGSVKILKSSWRLRHGERPDGPGAGFDGRFTQDWEYMEGGGDLDPCNGRWAVTPEFPKGSYLYVLTEDFPHIPRCWSGTPDPSFIRRPRPGGFGGRGRRPRPPMDEDR